MTEQASKKRRVETEADREASPEAATMAAPPPVVNNATSSPSPTRGSPSPNRTPRPVGEEPVYRSQAPSLKDHGQLSPPRVPECSLPGENRSNAPERPSVDLPLDDLSSAPAAADVTTA